MNEYFTLMTAARTEGKKSFKYKGTTWRWQEKRRNNEHRYEGTRKAPLQSAH